MRTPETHSHYISAGLSGHTLYEVRDSELGVLAIEVGHRRDIYT